MRELYLLGNIPPSVTHYCDECGAPAVTTWYGVWKCIDHYKGTEEMKARLRLEQAQKEKK